MLEHHHQAIESFVAGARDRFQAVVLTGSLAQGRARPDSDLDCYVVVTEEEYAERAVRYDLAHTEPCNYEGGYVDGKVVSRRVLEAAAERGSEPTRASFRDAQVLFSAIDDLQPLVDRIGRYPEQNRTQNITDFFGHFILHAGYFGPSALKKDDPFLLHHAVTSMTLYAGRLLLAHNRELFPCPKQLLDALGRCAELPDDFLDATRRLLEHADSRAMSDYLTLILSFRDWGVPHERVLTRFMELDEWSWLDGCLGIAQR
jgi:hypothetical protein